MKTNFQKLSQESDPIFNKKITRTRRNYNKQWYTRNPNSYHRVIKFNEVSITWATRIHMYIYWQPASCPMPNATTSMPKCSWPSKDYSQISIHSPRKVPQCFFDVKKWNKTHLELYPPPGCNTSGAILERKDKSKSQDRWIKQNIYIYSITYSNSKICMYVCMYKSDSIDKISHQHGVPTKVFLERRLSPVSNMQADTPKSASFTIPLLSSNMFPACNHKFQNNMLETFQT